MAALKAAKIGLTLLQNEKPRSSITALLDILTLERYEEDDYEGITELVEAINVQQTGPSEASRAIRKKLKYSNVHGQLRALTILKALVENCGPSFQTTFANERLVDRIKLMAGDPHTDERVKKKIMSVLGSWYRQFHDDPRMQLVAGLYAACGGGKKAAARTAATEAYQNQQARYEEEARERAERKQQAKEAERARLAKIAKDKEDKAAAKRKGQPKSKRPPFNFDQEKPKIMASVGSGTQAAQALINALQHVNREKESVTINEHVQECLNKAKADRKTIVRYIQLVDTDAQDFLGGLIGTNEQILTALALYDRMSKPIELDSDDDEIAEAKAQATKQGLSVPPGHDDDTTSIRSRLSAFDLQDREVDKLQEKQRARVERANRARQIHPDLQDLAFGPTLGSSTLPPPIQPRSAADNYDHGSLAEYSDGEDSYSSSEGEEYPASRGPPPTSASASADAGPSNSRSYADYIQAEDRATGKGKGLLQEDEEDDPFADPFEDGASLYSVMTPGIATENKRMEWRDV